MCVVLTMKGFVISGEVEHACLSEYTVNCSNNSPHCRGTVGVWLQTDSVLEKN